MIHFSSCASLSVLHVNVNIWSLKKHQKPRGGKGKAMEKSSCICLPLPPSPFYVFELSISSLGQSLALSNWEELVPHHSHGKSCQSKFGERKWRPCSLPKAPNLFLFLLFFHCVCLALCACVCVWACICLQAPLIILSLSVSMHVTCCHVKLVKQQLQVKLAHFRGLPRDGKTVTLVVSGTHH